MTRYANNVIDQFGNPMPGIQATVLNSTGSLAPIYNDAGVAFANSIVTTDVNGAFYFNASEGTYTLEYRLSPLYSPFRVETIILGSTPNFINYLVDLKSAPIDLGAVIYDQAIFTWTLGNYTGLNDDANIIKADSTALSVGAWVRQKSSSVSFDQPGAGAITTSMQEAIRLHGVSTQQYATPAGSLTVAVSQGVPLSIAGTTVNTAASLDGTAGYFKATGIAGKTSLTANSAMGAVIDIRNPSEVSYSPFEISGVDINGASLATIGIGIRYRRNYVLSNGLITNASTGVEAKDGNSGLMVNIRTSGVAIGLDSVGSNHQTGHLSCAFGAASNVGIRASNAGTAADGNYALGFYSCVTQDCAGRGIEVNYSTSADWYTGYLGESVNGYDIDNKGGTIFVQGGICFFDGAPGNYLVHPIGSGVNGQGGYTCFTGTRISAMSANGLSKLIHLTTDEVDLAKNGKVAFKDVDIYATISGGGFFNGDVIDHAPVSNNWVPRQGRRWTQTANGTATPATSGDEQIITSGGASLIGFYATIDSSLWRRDGPLFFIMCYKASKQIVVATETAPQSGGGNVLGVAPATSVYGTWITCEVAPTQFTGVDTLTLYTNGNAVSTDAFTLRWAGLADADFVKSGGKSGVLSNLYYP